MARTWPDPNPHLSELDDGVTKRQLGELAKRALETASRVNDLSPSAEQLEREQFQAKSNALAEENPLYAAARSIPHLVLPLEPNGTTPMVDVSEATQNDRQLYDWWSGEFKDCNPGVRLGRVGGLWALRVEDDAAYRRLVEMAGSEETRVGTEARWSEWREIGGAVVRLQAHPKPFTTRTILGWGKESETALREMMREDQERQPQMFWLVYSYPSVVSGQDAFDMRSRPVLPGVKLLGENETMPWDGAILEDGIVAGPGGPPPPEAPLWLARQVGKPRSRRAMDAQREAYEAGWRAINAAAIANEILWRRLEEETRAKANADREQAERILAEEMAKS